MNILLPVSPTHGLRPPDEATISVSTDSGRLVSQQRISWDQLLIGWAVDQDSVHHFLFVQGGLEHPHDGLGAGAKLEEIKQDTMKGNAQMRRLTYIKCKLFYVL